MRLPSAAQFGDGLRVAEVIIEYDGPQLVSLDGDSGKSYLAVHTTPSRGKDRWIYILVSKGRLQQFLAGALSPHAAFSAPEDDTAKIVAFDASGECTVVTKSIAAIPKSWLPESDSVAIIERTLLRRAPTTDLGLQSLPPFLRLPVPLWELSPEVIAFLKRARTPVEVAARRSNRLVADLLLKPDSDRTDVSLLALGRLLTVTQKLVDVLGQPTASTKGPIRGSVKQWTQLDAVAAFPSSFGLRIETHQGTFDDRTEGRFAVELLIDLLAAGSDESKLSPLLTQVGHRARLQYRAFAAALEDTDADLELNVGLPSKAKALSADLSKFELRKLRSLLDASGDQFEEVRRLRGRLVAVSLRTKFFLVEVGEDSFSGRIEDECLPKISGIRIDELYDVKIRFVSTVDEHSGDLQTKSRLVDIASKFPIEA